MPHRSTHLPRALALLVALGACGSDPAPAAAEPDEATVANSALRATFDGMKSYAAVMSVQADPEARRALRSVVAHFVASAHRRTTDRPAAVAHALRARQLLRAEVRRAGGMVDAPADGFSVRMRGDRAVESRLAGPVAPATLSTQVAAIDSHLPGADRVFSAVQSASATNFTSLAGHDPDPRDTNNGCAGGIVCGEGCCYGSERCGDGECHAREPEPEAFSDNLQSLPQ